MPARKRSQFLTSSPVERPKKAPLVRGPFTMSTSTSFDRTTPFPKGSRGVMISKTGERIPFELDSMFTEVSQEDINSVPSEPPADMNRGVVQKRKHSHRNAKSTPRNENMPTKLPSIREVKASSSNELKVLYRRKCWYTLDTDTGSTWNDQAPAALAAPAAPAAPQPALQAIERTRQPIVIATTETQTETSYIDAVKNQELQISVPTPTPISIPTPIPAPTLTPTPMPISSPLPKTPLCESKDDDEKLQCAPLQQIKPTMGNKIFTAFNNFTAALVLFIVVSWLFSRFFELSGLVELFVGFLRFLKDKLQKRHPKTIFGHLRSLWR